MEQWSPTFLAWQTGRSSGGGGGGKRGMVSHTPHPRPSSEQAEVWHWAADQGLGTPNVENSGWQSNTNAPGNISFCFMSLQFFTSLEQICRRLKEKNKNSGSTEMWNLSLSLCFSA